MYIKSLKITISNSKQINTDDKRGKHAAFVHEQT